MPKTINPKPSVEFEGTDYKLRSHKTEIPNLTAMTRTDALVWLNRYTTPRGRSTAKPNLLAGFGGMIEVHS